MHRDPKWQGLTNAQIDSLIDEHTSELAGRPYFASFDFARAIESKLKEKNT